MTRKTEPDTPANAPSPDPFKKVRAYKRKTTNERRLAYVESLLSSMGPIHEPAARAFLEAKEAQGLKPASRQTIAVALSFLANAAAGTPFDKLSEAELAAIMTQFARSHSQSSTRSWATLVRGFYRWRNDEEVPRHVRRALKRKWASDLRDVTPITDDEFATLLGAANDTPQRRSAAFRQAVLWTLWDSGFRSSELASLRIQDVLFDDKGGARLRLVERPAVDLKTGPRTVYVVDCVAPIRVWLAMHPHGTDDDAALFPSRRGWFESMWPHSLNEMVKVLCRRSSIRHINPHLFRHTRATRAARGGWNEAQMRQYFGWSPGSDMPAHYTHLAERDMEDQVRRDSGVDGSGNRVAQALTDEDLERMMKQTFRRLMSSD